MLAELGLYATAQAAPGARRLGYVREAVGIWSRYQRCKQAWQPHLEQCKQQILNASAQLSSHNTVLIFGSGLLYDLPMQELSRQFNRLLLLDIVQLFPARWNARRYSNAALVCRDITGLNHWLTKKEEVSLDDLLASPLPAIDSFHQDVSIDLVISLNLLSQLPLLPLQHLQQQDRLTEAESTALSHAIYRQHIAYLQQFSCPVCLITDETATEYDRQGTPLSHRHLLPEELLQSWTRHTSWEWRLAPAPEQCKHKDIAHTVGCYTQAALIP